MKKVALSLLVLAASAAYVWEQWGTQRADDILGAALPVGDTQTGSVPRPASGVADGEPPAADPLKPTPTLRPTAPETLGDSGTAVPLKKSDLAAPPLPIGEVPGSAPAPLRSAAGGVSVIVKNPAPSSSSRAENRVPRVRPDYRVTPVNFTPGVIPVAARRYADGAYTAPAVDAYCGLVEVKAIVQGGQLVGIKVLQYPSDRRTSVMINRQALPMLRDEVMQAQSANVDIISGATLTSEAFVRSINGALRQAK